MQSAICGWLYEITHVSFVSAATLLDPIFPMTRFAPLSHTIPVPRYAFTPSPALSRPPLVPRAARATPALALAISACPDASRTSRLKMIHALRGRRTRSHCMSSEQ